MKKIPGIKDVKSSYTEGMPEFQITVDRDRLKYYNTSANDVMNVFSTAISGQQAGVYANDPTNNGEDTDIIVRLKNSDAFKLSEIKALPVMAGDHLVRISDVAKVTEGTGPVMLRRVDKQRAINIQANITDRPLKQVLDDAQKVLTPEVLGDNISYRFTGQATSMDTTFSEMLQALVLSMILVYMLLDYALTLMERGLSAREAIIEAGKTRLKPILMTTITMVAGMLPTALAMTEGSETRVSMAWVLIGGLLTSTVFTLLIIPIIFLFFQNHPVNLFARLRALTGRLKGQKV